MPDLYDISSYDYDLPQELIAQYPLARRDQSRLMVLNRDESTITHHHFSEISTYLQSGDILIVNSSKVFPARLYGTKANGTKVEILLMHELEDKVWKAMVHPGKRLKIEQDLVFSDNLRARISLADEEGFRTVYFNQDADFWEEIYRVGHVPLPPYIERTDNPEDIENYQTVYAKELGSIAAPTAGFHFTPELLEELQQKGIQLAEVILHVGIGTFRPVKTERIDHHIMHSEHCTIPQATAELYNQAKAESRRVIAVGTTSLRTLESFFSEGRITAGSKWTNIFIYPGRNVRSIDGLITNFHLPKSTLLMLVSAFAGYELTRRAYQEAVRQSYRFFSYGDAMFIG